MTANYWTDVSWQTLEQKPLEIYVFVDPICPECWALEPVMKKLMMEYGPYIRIKHVLSGKLENLNFLTKKRQLALAQNWDKIASRSGMSCDGSLWLNNPIDSPFLASIAIKAAELQGKRAGSRFLRKIQEVLFIEKQDVSDFKVLKNCAQYTGLDVDEFVQDIHSASATKAFQCDVKIASEMDVEETPTLVFFNENIEDEGIKISGVYPYDVYEQIVEEMLMNKPEKQELPTIDEFIERFQLVATLEVAVVYNLSISEAEKELKKRMFQQKIECINAKHGTFWRSLPSS
ncbi:ClpXP adapter SpxH family protein [Jeotgalibacillus soli]|uniref:ClpXP adapter protein SpxH n=1 Tax=Jeotgalibacillus soli TaxID=889306 RepID=A0A0C2R611_9BACL|nr:ClpXP adapter SpxH family protein [Jeotgalibacillus soli]KIL45700.1 hypothetical protein KP78_20490 [Jeotgalibacillus soli]